MKRVIRLNALILVIVILIAGLVGCKEDSKETVKYNPKEYTDKKNLKILAVGNSYFYSSQVMEYFKQLLEINGKDNVTVDYVSKGSYQVNFFYKDIFLDRASMPEYDKLRNGEYDIFVLSTIYTHEDTPAVGDFLEALKDTDTDIILFPAANELTEAVNNSISEYYVTCANWQNFLTRLTYRHSFKGGQLGTGHTNEVGGFAGACLLYARLYNESPKVGELKDDFLYMFPDCFPGETIEDKGQSFDTIVTESLEMIKEADELYSTYR